MEKIIHFNGRNKPDDPMTKISDLLIQPKSREQVPPADLCWICPTCGPVQPLQLPTSGRWIRRSCACERAERARIANESIQQARMVELRYRCFGGWLGQAFSDAESTREMSGKSFQTFERGRFPDAYDTAQTFAHKPHGNLIFYGSYGVGKTHLEAAICNELLARDIPCYFAAAPQFFLAYNDLLTHSGDAPGLIKRATSVPLLVLDDIDKARPTEARWDTYWMILNARYTAGRSTILSTNRMDTLHEYIGPSAVSRLTRGMIPIEMIGNDYRLEEM